MTSTLTTTMAAALLWCRNQSGAFLPGYGNNFGKQTFRALHARGLLVIDRIETTTYRWAGRTATQTTAHYRNPTP